MYSVSQYKSLPDTLNNLGLLWTYIQFSYILVTLSYVDKTGICFLWYQNRKSMIWNNYSGRHWKVYECCFMKQNCHFQRGFFQYKNATTPLNSSAIHTTHQHFWKRYITLFSLRGLKSYQPSKFESVYFLSKTGLTFLLWLITFEPP